ncbi:MAG: hypothetical protein ACRCY8_09560 [Dermatophilaceae bacterium]
MAAATVLTVGLGAGAAHAVTDPGAVAPATACAEPFHVPLGDLRPNATTTFEFDIARTCEYRIVFFINYPETSSTIETTVDGATLADVITPAKPNQFGTYATTEVFELCAGRHTVTVTVGELPSHLGGDAALRPAFLGDIE